MLGQVPEPRHADYRAFRDAAGCPIDNGIALFFPSPNSFTGEDVLELQGHGGPIVLDMLLECVLAQGARLARPGEFSERAFLNDRVDLAQAEAIADLIDSGSREAARSAIRSLEGEFSGRVTALVEQLTVLRTYVEAAIDFSDEDIDFLADAEVRERFQEIGSALDALIKGARQGCLLREGIKVVIAGRPNAGKSSLLNRLAQRESAIVSEIPGTTRDVLREHIAIDGLPLHIIDTAGLRASEDPIERIGIDRAWAEINLADRILMVLDDTDPAAQQVAADLAARPEYLGRITLVHNKIDLSEREAGIFKDKNGTDYVALSALTGAGFEYLVSHLKSCAGYVGVEQGTFIARRRHLDALRHAAEHVDGGFKNLQSGNAGELVAEDLRQAQRALGEITGEVTSEDLLGRIFASFCIGK